MIQIFSARKRGRKTPYLPMGLHASSVQDLFENLESTYIHQIPELERWNLYYSLANTEPGYGRKFIEQHVMGFDIDDVENIHKDEALDVVLRVLGLEREDAIIVDSGNGLHIVARLTAPITTVTYFNNSRPLYLRVCSMIDAGLKEHNLSGHSDTNVFDSARLFRLPFTRNIKPEGEKLCILINPFLGKPFSLEKFKTGTETVIQKDTAINRFPTADTKAVLSGCEFLKHCKDDAPNLSEPEWYAMLSIVSRLEDGRALAHDFSKEYSEYLYDQTNEKIDQALKKSGPRTCQNIDDIWGNCKSCPNFNKVKSPILIKGEDFISTEKSGFWNYNEHGKPTFPNFPDLAKFYKRQHLYKSVNKHVFLYNGTHWELTDDAMIENFVITHLNPDSRRNHRDEFKSYLKATEVASMSFFEQDHRKINFKNGVFDVASQALLPHHPDYGFRYVLPYDYNPHAECPSFDKFMFDVTRGRQDLIDVCLEFIGYSISQDECWAAKALFLSGEGSNGKSTFVKIVRQVMGEANVASLNFQDLSSEQNRFNLLGKLANFSEETSTSSLLDSSLFKNMVTGGSITMKLVYQAPLQVFNRTKVILLCNDLPYSHDATHSLFRRILLVPFEARFSDDDGSNDPFIAERMSQELSGIFNRVIKAYAKLKIQRRFTRSETIDRQISEYQDDIDKTISFMSDELHVSHILEGGAQKIDIYARFVEWCQKRSYKPYHFKLFFKKLKAHIPDFEQRNERIGKGKISVLLGVKLVDEFVRTIDGNQFAPWKRP